MGQERDYYTATEAMEKLGLAKAVFYRKVDAGQIPKRTAPGRKQGVYPKRDIDALAEAMNIVFEKPDRFIFSKSSPGDQKEEREIGILCFGSEYITPLPERIAFQEKSEFTFWSLKVDSRVVGYVSLFRFPPSFLDDILTGRHIERDITVKEVGKFTRQEPFDVYVDVMAIDPRLPSHLRHLYAGIIVSRLANSLLDLRSNGYLIQTLYTVTATSEGDTLVRKLGFRLMEGKSFSPSRLAYRYDLDEKGLEQLRQLSRRRL